MTLMNNFGDVDLAYCFNVGKTAIVLRYILF